MVFYKFPLNNYSFSYFTRKVLEKLNNIIHFVSNIHSDFNVEIFHFMRLGCPINIYEVGKRSSLHVRNENLNFEKKSQTRKYSKGK